MSPALSSLCVPTGAWSQCHQPCLHSLSLQEPGASVTSLLTLCPHRSLVLVPLTALFPHPLWMSKGTWEKPEPRCPLRQGLSARIPAGMMPPGILARQDLGAAVPRPWPGWPRCGPRRASPPRQPGTPLALPKCLIKEICGAAEPGCNLALTVHLFQRLRHSAKVVGSLITGRQAAGAAGRRKSCGQAARERRARITREMRSALPSGAGRRHEPPCHSALVTAWLRSDRSLARHRLLPHPPPFWRSPARLLPPVPCARSWMHGQAVPGSHQLGHARIPSWQNPCDVLASRSLRVLPVPKAVWGGGGRGVLGVS